ncbi:hypothetical protein [Rhizobium ruizarguesonis]|uniref:hypothetical protein n=1 Tax=Rhizobium ruizarguesonis TaxID=2081791 RepID=UPI0013D7F206|nr:hypothetical protein [Rhizobium ruizarguesonis]NEH81925.1 hypothetical protein [Rhizobium ruizarguesonis]
MKTISDILRSWKLPPPLKIRFDDPTGFLFPFHEEGMDICRAVPRPRECSFTFIESTGMQAVAVQDEIDIVGVYAGMFWMLCRLASSAATSGVFPAMVGGKEPEWKPDVNRSLRLPRDLLDEGKQFNWEAESATWKEYPERQMLFLVILNVLFRFVVNHEVGHIWNDHGRRRLGKAASLCIDSVEPSQITVDDPIAAQAREIIADSFAFKRTIEVLDRELELTAELKMTKIVREKLLPNRDEIASFVLIIVFLYFRVSDLSNWRGQARDTLTHPPAPFRAHALAAALLEHRHLGISEKSAGLAIQKASLGSAALMTVILGIYPDLHWLENVSGTQDKDHFQRIFEEIPNWHGPLAI